MPKKVKPGYKKKRKEAIEKEIKKEKGAKKERPKPFLLLVLGYAFSSTTGDSAAFRRMLSMPLRQPALAL